MNIDDELRAEYLKIGITDEGQMREMNDFYETLVRICYNCYVNERKEGVREKFTVELKGLL